MKTTADSERKTERQAAEDLIYLCGCAVNGVIPDAVRIETMDFAAIYRTAQKHMLAAAAAVALKVCFIFFGAVVFLRRPCCFSCNTQIGVIKYQEPVSIECDLRMIQILEDSCG